VTLRCLVTTAIERPVGRPPQEVRRALARTARTGMTERPGQMRPTTTAKARLDHGKSGGFRPGEAECLAVLAVNRAAAIEFRCSTPRQDGKSRPEFGIRGMSVKAGS
jgi:hypothetical protein